jgi:hypothetical protein
MALRNNTMASAFLLLLLCDFDDAGGNTVSSLSVNSYYFHAPVFPPLQYCMR